MRSSTPAANQIHLFHLHFIRPPLVLRLNPSEQKLVLSDFCWQISIFCLLSIGGRKPVLSTGVFLSYVYIDNVISDDYFDEEEVASPGDYKMVPNLFANEPPTLAGNIFRPPHVVGPSTKTSGGGTRKQKRSKKTDVTECRDASIRNAQRRNVHRSPGVTSGWQMKSTS